MSVIAEQLKAARIPPKPKFEAWLLTLDEEDQAAFAAAASDVGIKDARIIEIVADAGYRVGQKAITAWRKQHGLIR